MILNAENIGIWKETFVTFLKGLFQNVLIETEDLRKLPCRLASNFTEI
jgi:hypothetical protein